MVNHLITGAYRAIFRKKKKRTVIGTPSGRILALEDSLLNIIEISLLPHQSQKRWKTVWRGLGKVPPISKHLSVGQCVIHGTLVQVPRLPKGVLAHHTTTDLAHALRCLMPSEGHQRYQRDSCKLGPKSCCKELLEGPPQLSPWPVRGQSLSPKGLINE